MSAKLLFLDLDGTLLDDKRRVTEADRAALADAQAAGCRAVIATGRPLASALIQAGRLALDVPGNYLIAYNGGEIYDFAEKKSIFRRTIPPEVVRGVFHEADRLGQYIQTYQNERVFIEAHNEIENVKIYCDKVLMDYTVGEVAHLSEAPVKMLASNYREHAPLAAFCEVVRERFADELDAFFSARELLEIVPRGLDKGTAVTELVRILGVDPAETVAVGDEINDIPMIRAAGVGACMVNGVPEAKAAADYVTEADNNHGGVAEVIRRYILK